MVPLMLSAVGVPVMLLASATPLANNIIAKTDETSTRMGLLITTAFLICSGTEEERGRDLRPGFARHKPYNNPLRAARMGLVAYLWVLLRISMRKHIPSRPTLQCLRAGEVDFVGASEDWRC